LLVIVPIVVFLPFFSCLEWHDERTKQWIEHQDQKLNVNDCKKALQFLKRKGIEEWNRDELQLWLEISRNGLNREMFAGINGQNSGHPKGRFVGFTAIGDGKIRWSRIVQCCSKTYDFARTMYHITN
jgi:hypothetical protein